MRQPQARGIFNRTTMWRRLRLALTRHYGWVCRQGSRVGSILGRNVAQGERAAEDRRRIEARARFWAEHREGEREAEAHCARLAPVTHPASGTDGDIDDPPRVSPMERRGIDTGLKPQKEHGA